MRFFHFLSSHLGWIRQSAKVLCLWAAAAVSLKILFGKKLTTRVWWWVSLFGILWCKWVAKSLVPFVCGGKCCVGASQGAKIGHMSMLVWNGSGARGDSLEIVEHERSVSTKTRPTTSSLLPVELPYCPVCWDGYDHGKRMPRVLHCGHTICQVLFSFYHYWLKSCLLECSVYGLQVSSICLMFLQYRCREM